MQEQLYYIECLLEINPENVRALERMNETYKKNEMYERTTLEFRSLLIHTLKIKKLYQKNTR